jgi:hypothetical protein
MDLHEESAVMPRKDKQQTNIPLRYLTVAEAARELRITEAHLHRLRCHGTGPTGVKLPGKNGRVLFTREHLDAWFAAHSEKPA